MSFKFIKGKIHPLIKEQADYYDSVEDGKGNKCIGYNYAIPAHTGNYTICDCWIVNKKGEVHPGLSNSPVPLHWESLDRE